MFVYLFFGRGNIRAEYMQYTLPVAVIILLLLMICIHAHFIRRIDSFGVNAGYYLSGDGGWAGQMQPAAVSANGDTGLVPAPKAGQHNSYLRGDGKWIQANNAPTAAQYCLLLITQAANANIPVYTNITFDFQQVSSGLSFTMPTSTFVLQPTCSYKLTGCLPNGVNRTQPAWYNVTTGKYIGTIGSGTNDQNSSALAVAYVICTVATTVAMRSSYGAGTMGLLANANVGQYGWATIEVVSNNNTILPFKGASVDTDGFIGYIPTPKAGQQNYVLTGSGNWAPPSILTYTNARIDGLEAGPSLKFTALSTSPTCPAPFVLTNPTTFTSPNISGNYKIDIVINNFATFTKDYGIITPVIGGVPSRTTITGSQIDNVPGGLSGMVILPIPANATLTFSLANVSYTYSGGTITIVSL